MVRECAFGATLLHGGRLGHLRALHQTPAAKWSFPSDLHSKTLSFGTRRKESALVFGNAHLGQLCCNAGVIRRSSRPRVSGVLSQKSVLSVQSVVKFFAFLLNLAIASWRHSATHF